MKNDDLMYLLWMASQEPVCDNCQYAANCLQARAGGTCDEWEQKK